MDNKISDEDIEIMNIGNFTRLAVQRFEENIVNQKNFLEKVDKDLKQNKNNQNPYNKFH